MARKATKATGIKKRETRKARFLKKFAELGNVTAAAKESGIDRTRIYAWRAEDEIFAAGCLDAEEQWADNLEEVAGARAIEKSDLLLIFLLKGAKPGKYGDKLKQILSGPNDGPIQTEDRVKIAAKEIDGILGRDIERTEDSAEDPSE